MNKNESESIRYYVRGLFRGIPESARLTEQRDELALHLTERIADAAAAGVPFEESFSRAVESLGNLEELVETMVGQKRKILARLLDAILMSCILAYGTLYMTAVGLWFARMDFGYRAIYVVIPGWLGFALPCLLSWLRYRSRPAETAMIVLNRAEWVRFSWIGWAGISAVCLAMNFAFIGTNLFLSVMWAWMPAFGLLTWPLSETAYAWMVRNLALIRGDV